MCLVCSAHAYHAKKSFDTKIRHFALFTRSLDDRNLFFFQENLSSQFILIFLVLACGAKVLLEINGERV